MSNTVEHDLATVVINYLMSKPGEYALSQQIVNRVLLDPKVSSKIRAVMQQHMQRMTLWQRWKWLLGG